MATEAAKDSVIRQRMLLNTASSYGGQIVALGAGFLLTPFILHHLGATDYGLWVLVGSVVAYGWFLDFGISGAVIKYVAEYRARGEIDQVRSLVATALALYSGLGLIAIALSAIIAPIFPSLFNVPPGQRVTATWLVLLAGIGVGISIPCATPRAVLRGLQRFDLVNLLGLIGTLNFVTSTIIVLLLGGGVLGIAAVSIPLTLAMQVPSIWLIYRVAPELQFGRRRARRALVRTVAQYSWSLVVTDMGTRLQSKTDQIVIAASLPVSAVTPYAFALRLSQVPQILTNQFIRVLLPLSSELHAERDWVRLRALYTVSTRLTLAIFLPIGCVIVLLGRPILTAWVGAPYAGYTHLVAILTLASAVETSLWPAGTILQGMARQRLLALSSLATGLVNLGLSIVLVRRMGLTGVALGTLIPTTIETFGIVLPYTMRILGVGAATVWKEIFLPAVLPALPTALVLLVTQRVAKPSSLLALVATAVMGLLVYLAGYLSVGATRAERQTCHDMALSTIEFARARLK